MSNEILGSDVGARLLSISEPTGNFALIGISKQSVFSIVRELLPAWVGRLRAIDTEHPIEVGDN
jgi:hypothetical protein